MGLLMSLSSAFALVRFVGIILLWVSIGVIVLFGINNVCGLKLLSFVMVWFEGGVCFVDFFVRVLWIVFFSLIWFFFLFQVCRYCFSK